MIAPNCLRWISKSVHSEANAESALLFRSHQIPWFLSSHANVTGSMFHPHIGIRHEGLETMASTRNGEPAAFLYRPLDCRYDLIGRVDDPYVVRARAESLVETFLDCGEIARIVGAGFIGFEVYGLADLT